jgi:hypothetical protein
MLRNDLSARSTGSSALAAFAHDSLLGADVHRFDRGLKLFDHGGADRGDAVTGELLNDAGLNSLCRGDIGLAADGIALFELGEPATIQRLCQIWVAAKRFVVVGQRIIQPV